MKLTAKVKLIPTAEQTASLYATLRTSNQACNTISDLAWTAQQFGQFGIHKLAYYEVKAAYPLAAQLIVRCIAKVCDAYKLDRETKRTFKPLGSIPYDLRILNWKIDKSEVSIWTVDGRCKIPFVCGAYHKALLINQRGESDLCLIGGHFYLFTTCDIDEPRVEDVTDFLGVDLGIANIATDSDGNQSSGKQVNGLRGRYARLRARLQAKQTKAAKRLLKKRRRKELRFAKDVNHCIAKALVGRAKDTGRGIALEDLTGIRERVTVRTAQRRHHSAWSFFDLRAKIEYKARLHGVPVLLVDPRNTSRTCSSCGCIDKANRKSQASFVCVSCGFVSNADTNAATNIRVRGRALVNVPHISTSAVAARQGQADVL